MNWDDLKILFAIHELKIGQGNATRRLAQRGRGMRRPPPPRRGHLPAAWAAGKQYQNVVADCSLHGTLSSPKVATPLRLGSSVETCM